MTPAGDCYVCIRRFLSQPKTECHKCNSRLHLPLAIESRNRENHKILLTSFIYCFSLFIFVFVVMKMCWLLRCCAGSTVGSESLFSATGAGKHVARKCACLFRQKRFFIKYEPVRRHFFLSSDRRNTCFLTSKNTALGEVVFGRTFTHVSRVFYPSRVAVSSSQDAFRLLLRSRQWGSI